MAVPLGNVEREGLLHVIVEEGRREVFLVSEQGVYRVRGRAAQRVPRAMDQQQAKVSGRLELNSTQDGKELGNITRATIEPLEEKP